MPVAEIDLPESTPASKPSATRAYWTHNISDQSGPVAQFRMSQLVDYDQRLTEAARTVYRFLIGWYVRGHGDALASVRHIVSIMRARAPDGARHLSRSAVQRAIVLLMDSGWLVRSFTGKGRSGSRYVPVLNVLELAAQGTLPQAEFNSVPLHRDTDLALVASHPNGTQLSRSTGTQNGLASHTDGTKTLLPDPCTDTGTGKERFTDCAPPSAPPGSATCGPTGADRTQGFDELWSAYGHRQKRADAKALYETLSPSTDLHRAMINSAHVWRERWEAQGDPNAARKTLYGWIRGEHFLEDPPTPYRGKERISKAPPSAKKPVAALVNVRPAAQIVPLTIEHAAIAKVSGKSILQVKFISQGASGKSYEETIVVESRQKAEQDAGQRRLQELLAAANIDNVDDADALIGQTLEAVDKSGALILLPADEWARGPRLASLGLAG